GPGHRPIQHGLVGRNPPPGKAGGRAHSPYRRDRQPDLERRGLEHAGGAHPAWFMGAVAPGSEPVRRRAKCQLARTITDLVRLLSAVTCARSLATGLSGHTDRGPAVLRPAGMEETSREEATRSTAE